MCNYIKCLSVCCFIFYKIWYLINTRTFQWICSKKPSTIPTLSIFPPDSPLGITVTLNCKTPFWRCWNTITYRCIIYIKISSISIMISYLPTEQWILLIINKCVKYSTIVLFWKNNSSFPLIIFLKITITKINWDYAYITPTSFILKDLSIIKTISHDF